MDYNKETYPEKPLLPAQKPKKRIPVLWIVLVILLAAAIGYLWFTYSDLKKQSTEEGGVSPAVSEKGETTPTKQPTEEVYQAEKTTEQVTVKKETVPTEEAGVSPVVSEKGEMAPRLQPGEEIQQTGQAAEVAVKEETIPTEEDEKAVQDEIAPILDVEGKPVILISEEDLEPVLSDDEVSNLLPKEIGIDWFDKSMINNPGDKVDIAAVPTGSAGGEDAWTDPAKETIVEEIIRDTILAPLPGLPGLPGP